MNERGSTLKCMGLCGIHTEQLKQKMLFFKKLLHGFLPCSRGDDEGEKKYDDFAAD